MRLIVTRCSIRYEGRLTTTLASGDRVILFKDDGSVCVHAQKGAKPINYMPGPTAVREEGRTIVINRPASNELLTIDIEDVYADSKYELIDEAKLVREGQEKEIQAILFANCDAIEEGLVPIERERFTDVGPVDLICRDAKGRTAVIEVKRVKAVAAAVEQLTRYMDEVEKNPSHSPARGILIAPELAPQARVLMEKRGYEFIPLDEILERCGESIASLTLF